LIIQKNKQKKNEKDRKIFAFGKSVHEVLIKGILPGVVFWSCAGGLLEYVERF
jgi:hypothetical protein